MEDVNQTSQTLGYVSFIKFNFIRMGDGMTVSLTLTAKGQSRQKCYQDHSRVLAVTVAVGYIRNCK